MRKNLKIQIAKNEAKKVVSEEKYNVYINFYYKLEP